MSAIQHEAGHEGAEHELPDGTGIRALPKVSLHDHLDGGLRPATILELADEIGLKLPADDASELAAWFRTRSTAGSLAEYLRGFEITTAVLQHREGLRRAAHEFVLDLAADGVVYGEIRWAPEQHLREGLSPDEAVEAVQEGITQGIAEARERGHRMRARQLLCAMRQADGALATAQLALRHRDRGVAGFDLAGPEDGHPPRRHQAAFDLLAESWFPVTVHAGEAAGLGSIASALLDARAQRLGHGVRIAEDITIENEDERGTFVSLGRIAQWVKDRQIALELCPSSNLQTGASAAWGDAIERHPFDLLYQLGFLVTVGTDNRLMSATTLTRELALLARAFDYDAGDLRVLQLNAASAAFLPAEDREQLAEVIEDGFDEVTA